MPIASVFSGLPAGSNIDTASFDGSVTLGGSVNLTRGDLGSRVQVKYVVSNNHIQLIRNGSVIADYGPDQLSADSNESLVLFQEGDVLGTGVPEKLLELHVPSIDGVPLSYTRFGTYAKVKVSLPISNSKIDPLVAFVFGSATPGGSMPTSGTASYMSDLFGVVAVPNGGVPDYYTLGDGFGSATFNVNFGTGAIGTAISLDADGRDFGDLTGTGAITSGSAAFHGTLTGSATGEFTGAFFGPSAEEMGYVFEGQGSGFLTYGNVFGVEAPPPP